MDPTIKIQRLKQVDYNELRRQANQMKAAGDQSLKKCKKLANVSKVSKEQDLLKQHRAIWHKELSRLNALRRGIQRELDETSLHALTDADLRHSHIEFETMENHLSKEREAFKEAVVDPVWMLSEDIKFYTQNRRRGAQVPDPVPIDALLDETRDKLEHVGKTLEHEEQALLQDLDNSLFLELGRSADLRPPQTGIPDEAWDAECPDDALKADLVQEFLIIDGHFHERFQRLSLAEENPAPLPADGRPWTDAERSRLDALAESYESHVQGGRHRLKMDVFTRACPGRTRPDLFDFDMWRSKKRSLLAHKRALIVDWTRARRELLNRVRVECAEASAAWAAAATRAEENWRQAEVCSQLFARVAEWRERRLEAALLQQRVLEEEERLREAAEMEEKEKEAQRRAKEKEKIQQFHAAHEEEKRIAAQEQEERLRELKTYLDEQAKHDRGRIEYREQLLQQRHNEEKIKVEEREAEAAQLQERLEMLRKKVRPSVESDPERVLRNTAAWQHRLDPNEEVLEQEALHQPLFGTNTYSDNQLMADPRLRVENALRQAGLVQSDYARSVMARLQPLHPPRKDLQSNIQFKDE